MHNRTQLRKPIVSRIAAHVEALNGQVFDARNDGDFEGATLPVGTVICAGTRIQSPSASSGGPSRQTRQTDVAITVIDLVVGGVDEFLELLAVDVEAAMADWRKFLPAKVTHCALTAENTVILGQTAKGTLMGVQLIYTVTYATREGRADQIV